MGRLTLILTILFILIISSHSFAQNRESGRGKKQGATDEEVLRVNTTLITVPVSVMDRQGRFIPNLRREDFRIYEEGVEQEVAFFETADKPFTVALLLDTSDSTKFKLKEIQDAANAFLAQLRPDDRVMIITFDKRINVLAEATNDRKVLARAISRAQTGGGTSLYDALNLVIRKRLSRISGRKAIVLFTDGVDTTSREATYQSTLSAAEELDAMAYAIQYNTYDDESKPLLSGQNFMRMTTKGETLDVAYKRANFYLRLLANDTGGHFFYADSLKRLNATFVRIAEGLRQQYSLGYYPKNQSQEGKRRNMKVVVLRPNVVVRARKSYIYKTQTNDSEKE